MRIKSAVVGVLVGLIVTVAAAVEIPLKNGRVLEASSYTITGSYLMVRLANGQRIAYDVADVDLEALRRAEAASAAPTEAAPPEEARPPSIMDARAAEDRPRSVITITDDDVAPARSEDEAGPAGEPAVAGGPPPGYAEGGGLVVDRLRVDQVDEGIWDVRGVIANRGSAPARDVRVQIDLTNAAGEALASPTLELTPELGIGETASFSHHVEATEQPAAKIRVFWTQASTPTQANEGARDTGPAAAKPQGTGDTPQPVPQRRLRG